LEFAPAGSMTMDEANEMIMAARAHWFADDPAPEEVAETSEEGDAVEDKPADA